MSVVTTDTAPAALIRRLRSELARIRQRGVDDIDSSAGRRRPLHLPITERVAETYARTRGVRPASRAEGIRTLLRDVLRAYGADHAVDSRALWMMYFDPDDARRPWHARERLAHVQRFLGLPERAFETQRTAMLQRFAGYLLTFVEHRAQGQTGTGAAPPPAVALRPGGHADAGGWAGTSAVEPRTLQAGPLRRHRRRQRLGGVGVIVIAVGVGVAVAQRLDRAGPSSATTPASVTGRITCADGGPLVAVWIQTAAGPNSHWAHTTVLGADTGTYEYVLPRGLRYSVDVGCGGTPQRWRENDHAGQASKVVRNLTCSAPVHDTSGQTVHGTCTG